MRSWKGGNFISWYMDAEIPRLKKVQRGCKRKLMVNFVLNQEIFSIFLSLCLFSLKVSALANFAHFRWYTDIQCKSIIYMLDNNIVLWSIRNKTSEKIVRLRHSKGVILITPWGWHGKRRIQISQKPQQFVGKMKCNTNRDVKSNNPVFDQDTAPRNTPSRGQFVVL